MRYKNLFQSRKRKINDKVVLVQIYKSTLFLSKFYTMPEKNLKMMTCRAQSEFPIAPCLKSAFRHSRTDSKVPPRVITLFEQCLGIVFLQALYSSGSNCTSNSLSKITFDICNKTNLNNRTTGALI